MPSNLDRFKEDLDRLLRDAVKIEQSFMHEAYGEEYETAVLKSYKGDEKAANEHMDALPNFKASYQSWYSESLALIKSSFRTVLLTLSVCTRSQKVEKISALRITASKMRYKVYALHVMGMRSLLTSSQPCLISNSK